MRFELCLSWLGALAAGMADTGPQVCEAELEAPVEKVWAVFSTEEGLKLLGVAQAKLDFRVGGKMQTHYDPRGVIGDEGTIENTIIAFEPMRMVAFRITKPPAKFPFKNAYRDTWTVATMTDLRDGRTRLRLSGMGYTADPESQRMRAFFAQGNAWTLEELKRKLSGEGAPAPEASVPRSPAARGPAGENDPLAPVVVEAVLRASPAEVWNRWTTREGMESVFPGSRIELRIGGAYELRLDPDSPEGHSGSEGCTVLSYAPRGMLSFSWVPPARFEHARTGRTWVVLHIQPHGAHRTRVILDHLGFAEGAAADPHHIKEWREVRAHAVGVWPKVLEKLRAGLESRG